VFSPTTLANVLVELVAPAGCAACDAPVAPRNLFCAGCAVTVERVEAEGCLAAFAYGGAIATAIARLKYHDRPDLAPRLADAMSPAVARVRGAADVVVPVPLHPRRLAERGYNQAALLSGRAARVLGAPHAPLALQRVHDTPHQVTFDRAARRKNVRGAFRARAPIVQGARILLVDDVRTTGATLEACASALHGAGAHLVLALVLAYKA